MIVMVTALNDELMKQKAKDAGANSYISKPYCNHEISEALRFCIEESKKIELCEVDIEDDFLDFDEIDEDDTFFDFDEDSSISVQKDMMDDFNKSHKQISAEVFLQEYPDLDYILDDLHDIEYNMLEQIDMLYDGNLVDQMSLIISNIEQYSRFLNGFVEFQELSISLHLLTRILQSTDFSTLDSKHCIVISEFIKAMMNDLIKWKDHVFIKKDAIDVYYINASLLSTCIQLEDIILKR
jgi:CheY-like chemotaxis protein